MTRNIKILISVCCFVVFAATVAVFLINRDTSPVLAPAEATVLDSQAKATTAEPQSTLQSSSETEAAQPSTEFAAKALTRVDTGFDDAADFIVGTGDYSSTKTMEDFERLRDTDASLLPAQERLCKKIGEVCEKYSAVGLSLVVFEGEKELYSQVYGYADKTQGILVDPDTKFRMASMSKFATGVLVMKLAAAGKVDLDGDISDYVGVSVRSPYYEDTVITVRMIMNHSSSIVDGDWAFTKGGDLSNFFAPGKTQYFSKSKPGSTFIYSNFAASLLTCVIEKASGEHFVNYSRSALLRPLGADAAFTIDQLSNKNEVAEMYSSDGSLNKSQKTRSATTYGCLNAPLGKYYQLAFGNLMISPRDMAKIGMIVCGDGTYSGERFLPADTVEVMNKTVPGSGSPWGHMQKIVHNDLVSGRTLHGHNGEAYGLISCIYFDREDKTGFVFASNGCSHAGGSSTYAITEAVAKAVYNDYIDVR